MAEDEYEKAAFRAMKYWIPCFDDYVPERPYVLEVEEIEALERTGKLIQDLEKSPSDSERALAAWELGDTYASRCAIPALIRGLNDESENVRAHCAASLGDIVRAHCAASLGDIDGNNVLHYLEQKLEDESQKVRKHAEASISKILNIDEE